MNGRKPTVKFFHIFGPLCYIVKDGENLNKMKEKGDACIFVGYSTQSKDETVTTSLNELDMLFSLMFDEFFNEATTVVSKSSAVTTANASDKHHQSNTTLSTSTTVAADTTQLDIQTTPEPITQAPPITATENIDQAENVLVNKDDFFNIFGASTHEIGESSSCHVYTSNMHALYQIHPSEHHWIRDHTLEQVIGNPSQSVRTRRQLETDGEIYMFALTMSHT
ncbi:hypothetical protein Tco_0532783 [Tanacetum coccineum]